jgi:hypothetical protein
MKNVRFTKEQLEEAISNKSYKWYLNELNIIGIRNTSKGNIVTNYFDDWITATFRLDDKWYSYQWEATTDPGRKSMLSFRNPNGVARLIPGQYIHCWELGKHKNQYEALRQIGNVRVTRDNNKDLIYDGKQIFEGVYGINIHKAGQNSIIVEDWSEGCQVFKKSSDFESFMTIVKSNGSKKFNQYLQLYIVYIVI